MYSSIFTVLIKVLIKNLAFPSTGRAERSGEETESSWSKYQSLCTTSQLSLIRDTMS
uniref:Uncharacterized protein n=1 Tax=Anguilla anguilla TaxID=7936 RepID=A0A0E9S0Q2_ANGAN